MTIRKMIKTIHLACFSLVLSFSNVMAHQTESCSHSFEHKEYQSALKQCIRETQQNPSANFILGQIYEKGLGLERNINKAMSYYRAAVLTNNVDAQIALGKLQANNNNHLQSHIFFSLAVNNGSLYALRLKNSAEKDLSHQELSLSSQFFDIVKKAIIEEKKSMAMN